MRRRIFWLLGIMGLVGLARRRFRREGARLGGGAGLESADAVELLKQEHDEVRDLFREFENSEEPKSKAEIARTALAELKVHGAIEEEIFYPAVARDAASRRQKERALEQHHVADMLIAELERMRPGGERYDAKFRVLAEAVKLHIEEEESEILPKAQSSALDLERLGRKMSERREELSGGLARPAAETDEMKVARGRSGRKGRQSRSRAGRRVKRAGRPGVASAR